jgi:hypothetical protein
LFSIRWKRLDSTWIVGTEMDATAVATDLVTYKDNDDELLVVSYGGEAAWHGFEDDVSLSMKSPAHSPGLPS